MYEGHSRDAWGRLSNLMALVANCHRGSRRRTFRPEDFNPHLASRGRGIPLKASNIHILKSIFIKKK
jgi:hypothetical protein